MIPQAPGVGMVYDNLFTMADGFIGRQTSQNDPYGFVLTWKHFLGGSSIVSIPLPTFSIGELDVGGWLHNYKQEEAVIRLLQSQKNDTSPLLDLNQLLFMIASALSQQSRLMAKGGLSGFQLYAKAVFHNIWRRVPFIDTETYIRFVTEYGFPVIQFDDEIAPPSTTFESLILIPEENPEKDFIHNQFWRAGQIWGPVLNAIGLPIRTIIAEKDSEGWWEAALRVPEVQRHRAKNFRFGNYHFN